MKSNIKIWKLIVLVGTMFFLSDVAHAKNRAQDSIPGYKPDTGYFAKRFIHRLGVEYRPGYIFQLTMEALRMGLFSPLEIFIPI